jgi:hypothetical protein
VLHVIESNLPDELKAGVLELAWNAARPGSLLVIQDVSTLSSSKAQGSWLIA